MEKITLKWRKINPKAVVPTKRLEDAGFDIYTIDGPTVIKPHETKMFNTGLVSMFGRNIVGIVKERGSTGSIGMSVRSGVIDSGYRGEWKICLTNENNFPIELSDKVSKVTKIYGTFNKNKIKRIIYPLNKAIAQVVFMYTPLCELKPLTDKDLADEDNKSERGEGGWGSSGK